MTVIELDSGNSSRNNVNQTKSTTIGEMLKAKLMIVSLAIIVVLVVVICFGLIIVYERQSNAAQSIDAWKDRMSREQSVWFDSGLVELKAALNVEMNTRRARNVILFVGDGMGPNTVTASRIYKVGESGRLTWEQFPHMGLLKVSRSVPEWT